MDRRQSSAGRTYRIPQPTREQRQRVLAGLQRVGLADSVRRIYDAVEPARRRDAKDTHAFKTFLAHSLAVDAHVVDIGAHRGDLLDHMRRLAPQGRQAAFEPLDTFAAGLRRDFPDVSVHEVALWDAAGESTFHVVDEEPAYSGLRRRPYPSDWKPREIVVRTARLDDELDDGFAPSLIKLDVEGAELQVLRGAERTLAAHRPTLYLEHDPAASAAFDATSEDLYDFLTAVAGLRVFDMDGNGPYESGDFASAHRQHVINFLARP